MKSFESRLFQLKEYIAQSVENKPVNPTGQESYGVGFFGGAGVSTASGIQDFRSKNGLYNQKDIQFEKYEPEYLLSHTCLYNHPKVFYEFYRQKMDCRNIEPNIIHYKLAEMEKAGILRGIVTQNIDGLHQKAGSQKVYEIHGTTNRIYCSKCGKEYPVDYIFTCREDIPKCECRGLIRPDVVLYGEQLPTEQLTDAIQNVLHVCNTLIVAGTSLVVQPAASLLTHFYGPNLVIINHDETPYDGYADLVFHEDIEKVFSLL